MSLFYRTVLCFVWDSSKFNLGNRIRMLSLGRFKRISCSPQNADRLLRSNVNKFILDNVEKANFHKEGSVFAVINSTKALSARSSTVSECSHPKNGLWRIKKTVLRPRRENQDTCRAESSSRNAKAGWTRHNAPVICLSRNNYCAFWVSFFYSQRYLFADFVPRKGTF